MQGERWPPVARIKSIQVGCVFDETQTKSLLDALAKFLPGTLAQHNQFLLGAVQALGFYRRFSIPHQNEMDIRTRQFELLEKAAIEYKKAIAALNRGCWADLHNRYLLDDRKLNPSQDGDAIEKQIEKARAEMVELKKSGDIAGRAANAAAILLAEKPPKLSASRADPAMRTLIKDIAVAYVRVFGERPSAAGAGIFSRALREILNAAQILMPEEKALSTLLAEADLIGKAPKRGRKPRK